MEQQVQIGDFIRDMRTARGMTQQQLADCLGITDKAVSKWERSVCYPDITLLRPLSDALGVTVAELLAGHREDEPSAPSAEDMVVNAISYYENAHRRLDWRLWIFLGVTCGCIIAAAVCMICDLAVNQVYMWSPPVYPSLGLGWLVCAPVLLVRRHPVRWSLAALSVAILPYLCGLGWMLEEPLVIKISIWVTPMALAYLWLVYALCIRLRARKWLAAAWSLLLTAPLMAGIRFAVARYVGPGGYHGMWIVLFCAAACFVVDCYIQKR